MTTEDAAQLAAVAIADSAVAGAARVMLARVDDGDA